MAYLQSITVLVIWAGFATHHARTPLPAALVCRGTRPTALWSAITTGKKLAYVYFEDEPGRRSAAKLLSKDEARRRRDAKWPEILERVKGIEPSS
jgi:hypothetical protein